MKRCSKNMQQIYSRTPIPKCDFNKVAKQVTGCSPVNLLHIFRIPFSKNNAGGLLLKVSLTHFMTLVSLKTSENEIFFDFFSGYINRPVPVDTGRKLKAHKTFRRRPGRLLNVLCTFKLDPVSTGGCIKWVKL